MNAITTIHKLLSIVVVGSGLCIGVSIANAEDASAKLETTIRATEFVQNTADSGKLNDYRNRIRVCKSTARGIRCQSMSTRNTNLIASRDMLRFSQHQARTEKICKDSPRGTRCTQQEMDFRPVKISGYRLVSAKKTICRDTSQGSRCQS